MLFHGKVCLYSRISLILLKTASMNVLIAWWFICGSQFDIGLMLGTSDVVLSFLSVLLPSLSSKALGLIFLSNLFMSI